MRKNTWCSVKAAVRHVCSNCNTGNNIEKENKRSGTGASVCVENAESLSDGVPARRGITRVTTIRPERRGATLDRSHVPPDRLADAVGPERGADLDVALVRDRAAEPCLPRSDD